MINHYKHGYKGQARKSLWIETVNLFMRSVSRWVRLVRACGSKLLRILRISAAVRGQARKSLWIETAAAFISTLGIIGQARKSLWIETYPVMAAVRAAAWSGS